MRRLLLLLLLLPSFAWAGSVTLSWTPPTQNEDGTPLTNLEEYHLYYGTTQGGPYPTIIHTNNPNVSTWVVDDLAEGTYYFVATARNTSGVESVWSNEATKIVGAAPPEPPTMLVVVDPTVFSVAKTTNMFVHIAVGTVPVGTECILDQRNNGRYAVPAELVTWAPQVGNPRPLVVVAECG